MIIPSKSDGARDNPSRPSLNLGRPYSHHRLHPEERTSKASGDCRRQWYYKIRWQGYVLSEDSWVREKRLREDVPKMVYVWE